MTAIRDLVHRLKDRIAAVPRNFSFVEARDFLSLLPGEHGAQDIGGLALPQLFLSDNAADSSAPDMASNISRGSVGRGNIVLEAAPLARFLIVAEPIRVQVYLPIDAGIFVNRAAQTVYAVVSITCVRMTLNTAHVNRCDIHRINADLLGIPIGMRIPPHLRPILRGGGTCAHTGAKNSAEQDE